MNKLFGTGFFFTFFIFMIMLGSCKKTSSSITSNLAGTHAWTGVQYYTSYGMGGVNVDTTNATRSNSIIVLNSSEITFDVQYTSAPTYTPEYEILHQVSANDSLITFAGYYDGATSSNYYTIVDTVTYSYKRNSISWYHISESVYSSTAFIVHSP